MNLDFTLTILGKGIWYQERKGRVLGHASLRRHRGFASWLKRLEVSIGNFAWANCTIIYIFFFKISIFLD